MNYLKLFDVIQRSMNNISKNAFDLSNGMHLLSRLQLSIVSLLLFFFFNRTLQMSLIHLFFPNDLPSYLHCTRIQDRKSSMTFVHCDFSRTIISLRDITSFCSTEQLSHRFVFPSISNSRLTQHITEFPTYSWKISHWWRGWLINS